MSNRQWIVLFCLSVALLIVGVWLFAVVLSTSVDLDGMRAIVTQAAEAR